MRNIINVLLAIPRWPSHFLPLFQQRGNKELQPLAIRVTPRPFRTR